MYHNENLIIEYGPDKLNLLGTGRYGSTNAGFFCQCSVLFTCILEYYKINGRWPMSIDTTAQFGLYKSLDKKNRDIFGELFQINGEIKKMNQHAFFHPDFHYGNYWTFPYNDYSPIIKRYFNPSVKLGQQIQKLENKYNIDYDNICAIYCRGTDKSTEQSILSKKFILNRLNAIMNVNPNIRLLFQSDQTEFIEEMREIYPNAIFFDENTHTTGKTGIHYIHNETDENYSILFNFIAIILIMSKCKYIITGSGNCSLWLALLRSCNKGYVNFFQFKNENVTPCSLLNSSIQADKNLLENSNIHEKINFIHIPKNGGHSIKEIGGNLIIYNYHDIDVFNNNITNQLIVIRNPIERFISSIYFALQEWSHEPQIKYLINNGIDTPEKWVKIWSDKDNCDYENLMSEMLNKSHYIGKNLPPYKWTYSPQSLWINNPKFIIVMDNFSEEIKYLLEKYSIYKDIPKKNTTNHYETNLSEKSIAFLRDFYNQDFILYEKYKNMNLDQRL